MQFGSFEEFWAALGGLYDSSVKNDEEIKELRASIGELRASIGELREVIGDLRDASAHLANAVQKDHDVIMQYERRHDRTEITVEAILEDLRRHREGRSPQ